MQTILLDSAIGITVFILVVCVIAQVIKDNSIVDIAWGIGFILAAGIAFTESGNFYLQNTLVNSLVVVWGIRLSAYIFIRHRGKGEDYRYKEMRESWGKNAVLMALLKVFLPQAIVMYILAFPVLMVNISPHNEIQITDIAGTLIWFIGFFFEAVGDAQMYAFKKNPENKGKVMRYGLWKYTRHPNYFGEATMWWGIFLIAIPSGYWYLSLLSPVVITLLIIKVTGVELLEKKYKSNPEYQFYINSTSSFFPWFYKTSNTDTTAEE